MCTHLSFDITKEKLKRIYNLHLKNDLEKSFNICPAQQAYILCSNHNELLRFRWGFIPHWAKEPSSGDHLIHAMAEGIESKDSFRMPFRQQRCVIFVDSFYDWHRKGRVDQQPYRIMKKDQEVMALAGVWSRWTDEQGKDYHSFAIITVNANKELHEMGWSRMPVLFNNEEEIRHWLDDISVQDALKMLKPVSDRSFVFYPISKAVEDINNNYADLHKQVNLEES